MRPYTFVCHFFPKPKPIEFAKLNRVSLRLLQLQENLDRMATQTARENVSDSHTQLRVQHSLEIFSSANTPVSTHPLLNEASVEKLKTDSYHGRYFIINLQLFPGRGQNNINP